MLELFEYKFFINAFLAAILASISCGVIGTYIVSRRMVFIGGGISHASFGGIGLGYYLGINPVLSAAVFAVLSGLGIELISRKTEVREDSMIGIFWSFGMALGIMFVYLTPGYAPNLKSYLFGSILTVSDLDLYCMVALNVLILALFWALFKEIVFLAFDEEYARTQGIPVQIISCVLICLVSLTIVINIRVVGIILVVSLLTIPQTIANLLSKNFKLILWYSILFGFISCVSGLFISYKLEVPSGACIIFSSILIFSILKGLKYFYIKTRLKKKLQQSRI